MNVVGTSYELVEETVFVGEDPVELAVFTLWGEDNGELSAS